MEKMWHNVATVYFVFRCVFYRRNLIMHLLSTSYSFWLIENVNMLLLFHSHFMLPFDYDDVSVPIPLIWCLFLDTLPSNKSFRNISRI